MISDLTDRHAGTLGTLLLAVAVLPFVLVAVPQLAGASHSFVVLSDSMSPHLNAGDIVFVDGVDPSALDEGDVITFTDPALSDRVTHRIVDVHQSADGLAFQTKGDANEESDAGLVAADNVVGRVAFHLPLLGHAVTFIGSGVGLLTFVVVPSFLLVVSELWSLTRPTSGEQAASEGGK